MKLEVLGEHSLNAAREWLSRNCRLLRSLVEEDVYYSHPCRDFEKSDEALRLRADREAGGKTLFTLTYKGPRAPGFVKVREEVSLELHSREEYDALSRVLEKLGFAPLTKITKLREEFDCAQAIVSLDEVAGLGHFIEVELKEGQSEESLLSVVSLMKSAGASFRVAEKTYLELALEKQRG